MSLFSVLFALYIFFSDQADRMFDTNLPIGLGGRVIYILCFFMYLSYNKKIQSESPDSNDLTQLNPNYWANFVLRELIFVILSIPIDFIAIFIAGYSFIAGSKLLCSVPKTSDRTSKVLQGIGKLLFPGLFVLCLLGFLATFFGNVPLIADFIALLLCYPIFKVMNHGYEIYPTLSQYLHFHQNRTWNHIAHWVKVLGLIIFIGIPTVSGLIIRERMMPQEFMVEMRDGTLLRTKVYFPLYWDGTAKPVVLSRTPYNSDAMHSFGLSYANGADVIAVVQDLRGTPADGSGSQGKFMIFRDDWSDGVDCVNWILNQTWCDGRIATSGGSALAINQMMYHPETPKGLRAASITVGTGELYDYVAMIGGCPRLGLLEGWLPGVAGKAVYYENLNWLMNHTIKDAAWAKASLSMNDRYKNIDVRAIHLGGWFDMFCQGTIEGFELYNQGTAYAQNHQILVMGPWFHGFTNEHLDVTYPKNAMDGQKYAGLAENLIFEEYLKNKTVDWDNIPRVYYYVMGDPNGIGSEKTYNIWKNASAWPIPATLEPWYLYPDLQLSPIVPTSSANLSYIYDPTDPVRNGGGTTLTLEYIGAVDQRRVEYNQYFKKNEKIPVPFNLANRSDILKFTSAPLTSQIEIIGRLRAELFITSNCTDTDFTAKLIDVYPDGREMWVAEGILKTRSREGYNNSVFMTPGNVYDLEIDMWSTAYRFTEGHQLRLSISSSNWNKFAVNTNTGGPITITYPEELKSGEFYYANNTVLAGVNGSLSCLWLPRTN